MRHIFVVLLAVVWPITLAKCTPPPLPSVSCPASPELAAVPCACGTATCAAGQLCDADANSCTTPDCPDPPAVATSACICGGQLCPHGGTCYPHMARLSACYPKCSDVPSSFWTVCTCGEDDVCGVGESCIADESGESGCGGGQASPCPESSKPVKEACECGADFCGEGQVSYFAECFEISQNGAVTMRAAGFYL